MRGGDPPSKQGATWGEGIDVLMLLALVLIQHPSSKAQQGGTDSGASAGLPWAGPTGMDQISPLCVQENKE